ncbi:MAG TPA: hypothetical protein VHG91_12335 [Longimicrobium sp.]|nr:hypothetical protein [Longimicrobium sp.]
MKTTLKRFVGSTALALTLVAGAFSQASAQCAEPLYANDANGKLVRVGWVVVAC